jgi:hypothetical protein
VLLPCPASLAHTIVLSRRMLFFALRSSSRD